MNREDSLYTVLNVFFNTDRTSDEYKQAVKELRHRGFHVDAHQQEVFGYDPENSQYEPS